MCKLTFSGRKVTIFFTATHTTTPVLPCDEGMMRTSLVFEFLPRKAKGVVRHRSKRILYTHPLPLGARASIYQNQEYYYWSVCIYTACRRLISRKLSSFLSLYRLLTPHHSLSPLSPMSGNLPVVWIFLLIYKRSLHFRAK